MLLYFFLGIYRLPLAFDVKELDAPLSVCTEKMAGRPSRTYAIRSKTYYNVIIGAVPIFPCQQSAQPSCETYPLLLPRGLSFFHPTALCFYFCHPSSTILLATGFARQTGDLRSLSRVDLRVIALTYMLERQETGGSHLRTAPVRTVSEVLWHLWHLRNLHGWSCVALQQHREQLQTNRVSCVTYPCIVLLCCLCGRQSNVADLRYTVSGNVWTEKLPRPLGGLAWQQVILSTGCRYMLLIIFWP